MLGKPKLHINLLYSAPLKVKDTKALLDGEVVLSFKDLEISEYPPHLGKVSMQVAKGGHKLEVLDSNFKLKKTQSFKIQKEMWIDIIIHDDSISVHLLDKEPHYK
jgi:hypothetical protein